MEPKENRHPPRVLLNNGMAKSGSTLLMYYCQQILRVACPENGDVEYRAAVEHGDLVGKRAYIEPPDAKALDFLENLAAAHGPLVAKTHCELGPLLAERIKEGRVVVATTYRDPRDVILSAIDHRRRSEGSADANFHAFTDVVSAIPHARWWAEMAVAWVESGLALAIRYEHLIDSPEAEIARVAEHWGIAIRPRKIERIVLRERQFRKPERHNFNVGKAARFLDEMTPDQLAACNEGLGDLIVRLGYPIDRPRS